MNFALCHEVCHVCINSDMDNNTAEVYIDDTYLDHKNERIANQFAGMILMPERHIRRMFEKFSSEIGQNTDSNTSALILICKLMSYFKAPYMAVLIRLTELELIKSRDILKTLLGIQPEDIERIYSNQWLDTMELKPSYRDDFDRLRELVVSAGEDNIEQELIYESDLSESLKNLDNIYLQIREEL